MMNPKLRKFLEANGLKRDASDHEAWQMYDQMKKDGIELPGIDPGQRSDQSGAPAGEGNQPPEPNQPEPGRSAGDGGQAPAQQIDVDEAVNRALAADR